MFKKRACGLVVVLLGVNCGAHEPPPGTKTQAATSAEPACTGRAGAAGADKDRIDDALRPECPVEDAGRNQEVEQALDAYCLEFRNASSVGVCIQINNACEMKHNEIQHHGRLVGDEGKNQDGHHLGVLCDRWHTYCLAQFYNPGKCGGYPSIECGPICCRFDKCEDTTCRE